MDVYVYMWIDQNTCERRGTRQVRFKVRIKWQVAVSPTPLFTSITTYHLTINTIFARGPKDCDSGLGIHARSWRVSKIPPRRSIDIGHRMDRRKRLPHPTSEQDRFDITLFSLTKRTAVIGAISTDPSASSARKLHNALVAGGSPQQ